MFSELLLLVIHALNNSAINTRVSMHVKSQRVNCVEYPRMLHSCNIHKFYTCGISMHVACVAHKRHVYSMLRGTWSMRTLVVVPLKYTRVKMKL